MVSEFGLDANGNGDAASERRLLGIDQPFANHNGGMIAFGADGYLYIGMGDGGSGGDPLNNGQRLDTLLGKMLRIDVNSGDPYAIPADNPYADGNGGLAEIWSSGLRNPWRFSFDRATGGMFIGDVGQNVREEVDVEPAGEGGRNYGWNIMEADVCYARLVQSTGLDVASFAYGRDDGSCSVTGGYVYRGAAPSQTCTARTSSPTTAAGCFGHSMQMRRSSLAAPAPSLSALRVSAHPRSVRTRPASCTSSTTAAPSTASSPLRAELLVGGRGGPTLEDQVRDERRPAGLLIGAEAFARVSVEVLVKTRRVFPVVLHVLDDALPDLRREAGSTSINDSTSR